MALLAKLGSLCFALWLIFAAIFMVVRPQKCLLFLRTMGSTAAIHFGEHSLRALAGLSLIGLAPQTSAPLAYKVFGAFLLVTSIMIVLAPRRWHHRYAQYWALKISPKALSLMAILPLALGIYLTWVVLAL